MQISYIEENNGNVIKWEPVIKVYNKNYTELARYDSNKIKRIEINESVHEKNGANVGTFTARLLDLSLNLDRTNLDLASLIYSLEMYYLEDEDCIIYDENDNTQPIGLTYDDDLYQEDIENLGTENEYTFHYSWSSFGIGNFYPTSVNYNRDTKTYEFEMTDIPTIIDSVSPPAILSGTGYCTFNAMMSYYIPDALTGSGIECDFECDSDIANYEFDYTTDYRPSIRELIGNVAFAMNANARMEYVDLSMAITTEIASIIGIRRFGENKYKQLDTWYTDSTPTISYEKIRDYYFEQERPYQDYLNNITLEASGKKITFSNWAYGYLAIKNRMWKDHSSYAIGTIHRQDSVLNFMQSWEYDGEAMFHLRAGDKIIIDNKDLYIGQLTHTWDEGASKTTMQQKLLTSGDCLMVQVDSDKGYTVEPYIPPTPDITDFDQMTYQGIFNAMRDYYNGTKNPTVTNNYVEWENGTKWKLGDTIDIEIDAIPATQTTPFSHAANTLTFKIVGINHHTISGTNTKALLTLWCCSPYLDDDANLPNNKTRANISNDSYEFYDGMGWGYDWGAEGWFSQAQMGYSNGVYYADCPLIPWLDNYFVPALPTAIQNTVKAVDINHWDRCNSSYPNIETDSYSAFLLSEAEIRDNDDGTDCVGPRYLGSEYEGPQLEYFKTNDCRIPYTSWNNSDNDSLPYWFRTPSRYNGWVRTQLNMNASYALSTMARYHALAVQPCICL